jgi:hypothetical protein
MDQPSAVNKKYITSFYESKKKLLAAVSDGSFRDSEEFKLAVAEDPDVIAYGMNGIVFRGANNTAIKFGRFNKKFNEAWRKPFHKAVNLLMGEMKKQGILSSDQNIQLAEVLHSYTLDDANLQVEVMPHYQDFTFLSKENGEQVIALKKIETHLKSNWGIMKDLVGDGNIAVSNSDPKSFLVLETFGIEDLSPLLRHTSNVKDEGVRRKILVNLAHSILLRPALSHHSLLNSSGQKPPSTLKLKEILDWKAPSRLEELNQDPALKQTTMDLYSIINNLAPKWFDQGQENAVLNASVILNGKLTNIPNGDVSLARKGIRKLRANIPDYERTEIREIKDRLDK